MGQNPLKHLLRYVTVGAFFFVLVAGGAVAIYLYDTLKDLPDVASLKEFRHSHATEVYSADKVKIGEFTTQRRYPVEFDEIPTHVIRAFLAAEDSGFYEHQGVDPVGILRAVLSNLMKGRYAQGGSTITQQVARSIVLGSRQKKISRKIREMLLAWQMEKSLSKNEILSLYLSEIYLGHGAFGIGAAARNYYNKKVHDLTLAEAAMLAGLPQRPNDWNPFRNPHLSKRRQRYVLSRMVDEGFVTADEAERALTEPLRLYAMENMTNIAAPYFTEHIRLYLMNKYGSEDVLTSGYKVYTTLNYKLQQTAQAAVNRGLRAVDKRLGWRGVKEKLSSPEEITAFNEKVHTKILERDTNVRILEPNFESDATLVYDLTPLQGPDSAYFGETPILQGEYYQGVVTAVDDKANAAEVTVGRTKLTLPVASMEWVVLDKKQVTNVSEVVAAGDVIEVRVDAIDRKTKAVTAYLEQEPEVQGALLSFDVENGKVRAMVGGRDFEQSKFNIALQAKRQVGSTFKPIVYAAAIDKGFSPSSIVTDSPIVFKFEGELDADNVGEDWRPRNYGGRFKGEIPLRLALIRSMNIPTVKILDQVSVDFGIDYARKLGITAELPRDLSIGLGSWSSSLDEVLKAYAVFARMGRPVELSYINKVVDINGNIVEQFGADENPNAAQNLTQLAASTLGAGPNSGEAKAPTVIPPETAYVIVDLLKGVVQEGTGRAASVVPGEVAGKTGTSSDHRDAWFVGFTPNVISGVWVGYEKDKPLESGETGGRAAAPIWVEYMQETKNHYPKARFPVPEGVVFAYVDKKTGKLARVGNADRVRVAFRAGTVPNATGSNLLRVGEPGVRARIISDEESTQIEAADEEDAETSDFLRQGYSDEATP